jgi:hypothetical protein
MGNSAGDRWKKLAEADIPTVISIVQSTKLAKENDESIAAIRPSPAPIISRRKSVAFNGDVDQPSGITQITIPEIGKPLEAEHPSNASLNERIDEVEAKVKSFWRPNGILNLPLSCKSRTQSNEESKPCKKSRIKVTSSLLDNQAEATNGQLDRVIHTIIKITANVISPSIDAESAHRKI